MDTIKLFCLPYAGGSATLYNKWTPLIHDHIEIIPVELRGRGSRLQEPLHNSLLETIDESFENVLENLKPGQPFAFFGHSMGSIIVYEIYYRLLECTDYKPLHIFFSGSQPNNDTTITQKHTLPDDELLDYISRLGGIDDIVLQNKALVDLFLPIIRNDLKILKDHTSSDQPDRINCNYTILCGKNDIAISPDAAAQWHDYCEAYGNYHIINGGHFFINTHTDEVARIINSTLTKELLYVKQ